MAGPPQAPASSQPDPSRRTGRRAGGVRRIAVITVSAIVALVVLGAAIFVVVVHRAQPAKPDSFYTVPSPLPHGPSGTVIRSEPIHGLPAADLGWRILYLSTSYTGKATAISGLVFAPRGTTSTARNVVAFAHGTLGVAPNCAPSLLGSNAVPFVDGLQAFLAAGDVVAATDYQGLGTPGPHPYLIGRSEADAILDSVRAAHAFKPAHAGTTFAVFGPSQGGQAALFTGQLAGSYAPELKLVGVAAAAPATDLKTLLQANIEGPFGKVLSAYALDSWSRMYGHDLDAVFKPVARPIVHRLVRYCIQNEKQSLAVLPLATILKVGYLKGLTWQKEPWQTLLKQNTPGEKRIPAPIFIAQGAADGLVRPPVTAAFVSRLCRLGERVEYRTYPGVDHVHAGPASAADAAQWMAARFAGKAAPSTC